MVTRSIDGLLFWQNSTYMHRLSPQKTVPIASQDTGLFFSIFPWAVLCDAIPSCHFVSRSV